MGGVKILSTKNQGVSQARNEGIKLATGDFLYFLDPDDYISPDTLEIIYNRAIETNSDAIQFDYQTKYVDINTIETGHNGNKKTGIYKKEDIIKTFLPRYIGYSIHNIKNYGQKSFYANKEMCSVWRFLYKRKIITDNNILFPINIQLGEDTLFNCHFFCYANKICYIKDVLYTYHVKKEGAMSKILNDIDLLYANKTASVIERNKLRLSYKSVHNIDIFPLYAGSLFLSTIELAVKSSNSMERINKFKKYTNLEDVRNAINSIPLKGNLKIKLLLLLLKTRLISTTYTSIFIANKLRIKLQ